MQRTTSFVALALLAFSSMGCSLIDPDDCTADIRFGLNVTATDGGYAETLEGFPDGLTFRGLQERPGVYDIAVNSPGYQPWTRQNVEVEDGSCHVKTETIEARLQPLGN